jgi:hypothetical protein
MIKPAQCKALLLLSWAAEPQSSTNLEINEYLTNQPTKTMPNITQLIMTLPLIALVA